MPLLSFFQGASRRRIWYHGVALLVLLTLHGIVFAPWLVLEADGLPSALVPWDFIDSYHRLLLFISDTFRAGALPTWFPYGNAGQPHFLNPQNQLWNPLTWLFTWLGGYTLVLAQWQLILTLLMGGIGAYALAHQLCRRRMAALFTAIAYSLTSARLGNLQHLDIINALTLYPWLFWAVHRVATRATLAVPILAFFGYCFIVCGYPGVVLLSPMWLGAWAAFVVLDRGRGASERLWLLADLSVAVGLALLLGAGYWVPIVSHADAFTRSEALPVASALAQSLSFRDLGGIVFAWSSNALVKGALADVSMRGLYFGIITLPFALAAVVLRRDRLSAAIAIGAFCSLLMALGASTSLRQALNTYLPILNISRFPAADSRGVAVLGACLLCGLGFQSLEEGLPRVRTFITCCYLALLGLLVTVPWLLERTLFSGLAPAAFMDRALGPILGQVLWLAVALLVLARGVTGARLAWALCSLAALDLSAHVQTERPIINQPLSAEQRSALIAGHVQTFDPALATRPRGRYAKLSDVRNNAGYSSKEFFLGGYGPFRLKTFELLINAGFADWLTEGPRVVAFPSDAVPSDAPSFTHDLSHLQFTIDRYVPDAVDYTIVVPSAATVVFNEVHFPGWRASVDGGPTVPMREVAGGLRALDLTPGEHRVRTWFSPDSLWLGVAGSALGFLVLVGWMVWWAVGARTRTKTLPIPSGGLLAPVGGDGATAAREAPVDAS